MRKELQDDGTVALMGDVEFDPWWRTITNVDCSVICALIMTNPAFETLERQVLGYVLFSIADESIFHIQ